MGQSLCKWHARSVHGVTPCDCRTQWLYEPRQSHDVMWGHMLATYGKFGPDWRYRSILAIFRVKTIYSAPAKDICSHPGTRPRGEDNVTRTNKHNEIGLNSQNFPSEIAPPPDSPDSVVSDEQPNSAAQNAQKCIPPSTTASLVWLLLMEDPLLTSNLRRIGRYSSPLSWSMGRYCDI